jgi:hypothetical protein
VRLIEICARDGFGKKIRASLAAHVVFLPQHPADGSHAIMTVLCQDDRIGLLSGIDAGTILRQF